MHLYQMPGEWREIEDALEESQGEITPEIEERLAEFDQNLGEAVSRYYEIIANRKALATALLSEEAQLKSRRECIEDSIEAIESRLLNALTALGKQPKERISSSDGLHYVEIKENPLSVKVDCDPVTLPVKWQRIIPMMVEADKKTIKADFEAGAELPEGVSVERTRKVVLK